MGINHSLTVGNEIIIISNMEKHTMEDWHEYKVSSSSSNPYICRETVQAFAERNYYQSIYFYIRAI